MKVLLLSTTDKGGAANACIRLHQGLLEIGVESKILVLQKNSTDIPEVHRFLSVYEPSTLLKRIMKAPRVLAFRKKRRKAKGNHRPTHEMFSFFETLHDITKHPLYDWADVINIHWVANFLDYPSFFAKNTKPVVWTLHDMLLFTGGYHYEKGFPFDAYQDLIEQNYQLKKRIFANQKFTIVTPSKWLHREAKAAQDLYPKAKHALIPYGLQTDIFKQYQKETARKALGIPLDKKIILFVAASVNGQRKGIQYLLDALPLVNTPNLGLAVMGANIEKLDLDKQNTYPLGYISDIERIAQAYAAADIFVIPSIEDNLPNTVLESLCCGTPVVGFDIGGIPDMVIEGKNGEICSSIDAKALAQSIETALNTSYDRKWIRSDAHQRYALPIQAEAYLKLFESL